MNTNNSLNVNLEAFKNVASSFIVDTDKNIGKSLTHKYLLIKDGQVLEKDSRGDKSSFEAVTEFVKELLEKKILTEEQEKQLKKDFKVIKDHFDSKELNFFDELFFGNKKQSLSLISGGVLGIEGRRPVKLVPSVEQLDLGELQKKIDHFLQFFDQAIDGEHNIQNVMIEYNHLVSFVKTRSCSEKLLVLEMLHDVTLKSIGTNFSISLMTFKSLIQGMGIQQVDKELIEKYVFKLFSSCAKINAAKTLDALSDLTLSPALKQRLFEVCLQGDLPVAVLQSAFNGKIIPTAPDALLVSITKAESQALEQIGLGGAGDTFKYEAESLNFDKYFAQRPLINSTENAESRKMQFPASYKAWEEIRSMENGPIKREKMSQLANALALMEYHLNPSQIKEIEQKRMMPKILAFGRPDLRLGLVSIIIENYRKSSFEPSKPEKEDKEWIQLTKEILHNLSEQGVDGTVLKNFMATIKKGKTFYKGQNHQVMLEALIKLAQAKDLSAAEKEDILLKVCTDEQECLNNLQALTLLFLLGSSEELKEMASLKAAAESKFKEVLGVDADSSRDFLSQYTETFAASRQPMAIQIYLAKIHSLGNVKLMRALREYVITVLDGSFQVKRYALESNQHLQKINAQHASVLEKWKDPWPTIPMGADKIENKFEFNGAVWLKENLSKSPNATLGLSKGDYLADFLKEDNVEQRARIKDQLKKEWDANKSKKNFYTPIEKNSLHLQVLFLELAYASKVEKQKGLLRSLEVALEKQRQNVDDGTKASLTRMLEQVKIQLGKIEAVQPKQTGLTVVDSDNPIDLLLCGTEINDSCQRVAGDPLYSRALLAYLMDGKNRMLAVQDKDGRTISRCFLRLMWDDKNQKPVLFLDKVYPFNTPSEHRQALKQMGEKKAQALGISLLGAKESGGSAVYLGSVKGLGGPVSWEYYDHGGGLRQNGKADIHDARVLWSAA